MTGDQFSLQGKTALITGGGTGLGRQFALTLCSRGASVILCGRRLDKVQEVQQEVAAAGGTAFAYAMDVTDEESIQGVFDTIYADLGELLPVNVLVNNAGYSVDPQLLDLSDDQWDQVFDTNLKGAWKVSKCFAQRLIVAGCGGSIINIASILGISAQKCTGPYSASKAGLIQLTRVMALEWARYNIRANALLPGYVVTDIIREYLKTDAAKVMLKRIPQRRMGEAEEIAGPLVLLASDASAYMTGSEITVDGGHSMRQTL